MIHLVHLATILAKLANNHFINQIVVSMFVCLGLKKEAKKHIFIYVYSDIVLHRLFV